MEFFTLCSKQNQRPSDRAGSSQSLQSDSALDFTEADKQVSHGKCGGGSNLQAQDGPLQLAISQNIRGSEIAQLSLLSRSTELR